MIILHLVPNAVLITYKLSLVDLNNRISNFLISNSNVLSLAASRSFFSFFHIFNY